jgi:hypothetical protein
MVSIAIAPKNIATSRYVLLWWKLSNNTAGPGESSTVIDSGSYGLGDPASGEKLGQSLQTIDPAIHWDVWDLVEYRRLGSAHYLNGKWYDLCKTCGRGSWPMT